MKYGIKTYDNKVNTTLPALEVYETISYNRTFPTAANGESVVQEYIYKNPFDYIPLISMFIKSGLYSGNIPGFGVDGLAVAYSWSNDKSQLSIRVNNFFNIGRATTTDYSVKFYVYRNNFLDLFGNNTENKEISFV